MDREKELFEWVRGMYREMRPEDKKDAERFFPELAESEDERIRKALIQFLTDIKGISESGRTTWAVRREDAEMCNGFLIYLEKQKGANLLNNEKYQTVPIETLDRLYTSERELKEMKQKEQKSRIDACGFPLREEGESACSYLERCLAPDMRNIWYEACLEIKERHEKQKPAEWSEEDETMLDALIRRLEGDDIYVSPHLAAEWLKSLRPQPHWKPSEEQMEELGKAKDMYMKSSSGIASLYYDLKTKLM